MIICSESGRTAKLSSDRKGTGRVYAYLKNHAHCGRHLDDLTVGQAQLFVVIQYSVHVLNPQGIHRSVQDQPLASRTGVCG